MQEAAQQTTMMEFKDYYATLGVPKTATEKEIKQAFRKMARKYHPDVNPGDKSSESRFKEINEAYEVDRRSREAQEIRRARIELEDVRAGAARRRRGPAVRSRPWNVNMGGGGGQGTYRTMTAEEMRDLFGNEDPFSDFFHAFFSGSGEPEMRGRGGRAGTRLRAPDRGATSSTRSTCRSKMRTGARHGGCR